MSLFGSLIPGVREVRAPLAAGYLWLICGWLMFGGSVPSAKGEGPYERLVEIGSAVGPVGLALAASVAAYLAGSLIQAGFRRVWSQATARFSPLRLDEEQHVLFEELAKSEEPRDLLTILEVADPFQEASLDRPFFRDLSVAVWEIADRELMESFRQLQLAVRTVSDRTRDTLVSSFGMHARTPVVRLPIRGPAGPADAEYVIPHFLPSRDLLGQISLLQTRLMETAESTGAQIERLHAEAEFRFTIAPPLAVLVLILTLGVSLWWTFGLIIPVALVIQGISLSQQGAEEVLDALRARTQTPELEQITPIFERYRTFASELINGLASVDERRLGRESAS